MLVGQQEQRVIVPQGALLFLRALLQLGADLGHSQRVQHHGADGVLVLAAGLFVLAVDGPPDVHPVTIQIAHAQAQQLTRAQAGHDRDAVGVHVLVLLHFSTHHTGVGG